MARRAVARRTVGDGVRLRLRQRDKFLKRLRGHIRRHCQQAWHARQQDHGRELFIHVVGMPGHRIRIDCERANMPEDDGVAIGLGLRNLSHRDHAGTARFVFDEYRLAKHRREFRRHRASHDLTGAARREWHHETDGFCGPLLGASGECDARKRQCCKFLDHDFPLIIYRKVGSFYPQSFIAAERVGTGCSHYGSLGQDSQSSEMPRSFTSLAHNFVCCRTNCCAASGFAV